jgi:diguanylate cyclase (GGDEF)-like protein
VKSGTDTGRRPWKMVVFAGILALLAIEALVHWMHLPLASRSRLLTLGGLAEIAIWVLLFSVLLGVQLRRLPPLIYGLLTAGLAVWLSSQTADLMDEFLRQPLWLSAYGEDAARVVGMLLVMVGVLALIRHSAATMHELEYLSLHDSLTGLYNRRMLQQDTRDFGGSPYSILLLDLDHFKSVNDRFGHEAGDDMLRGLSKLLLSRFRDRGRVYRLGGEEFAVVVEPMGEKALFELGDEVRKRIAGYHDGPAGSVSASIGVGTRRDGERPSDLMRRVDRALYAAKGAGRDRVVAAE